MKGDYILQGKGAIHSTRERGLHSPRERGHIFHMGKETIFTVGQGPYIPHGKGNYILHGTGRIAFIRGKGVSDQSHENEHLQRSFKKLFLQKKRDFTFLLGKEIYISSWKNYFIVEKGSLYMTS